jgi:2-polyprenyl-3-methyl-5-hydroxy-6-metoxy-1,4-benzoquinol methylase
LSFVNPLGNYNGEHEADEYFEHEYQPLHDSNRANSMAERRAHLALIRRHFDLPERPRLLDVGCALGYMLEEARLAGWDAFGVETSAFAARHAEQQSGCPVYAGTLQQAAFPSDSFDVVTLMDVIEHVPEPCPLIDEIYRVLRRNGVLFIVTPNFASVFVHLYKRNAYGIGPEEHVVHYEPSTIKTLLKKSGFTRVTVGSKDIYADNLRRLLHRDTTTANDIKASFGGRSHLRTIRGFLNRFFMYVPIGDKLIALGQK